MNIEKMRSGLDYLQGVLDLNMESVTRMLLEEFAPSMPPSAVLRCARLMKLLIGDTLYPQFGTDAEVLQIIESGNTIAMAMALQAAARLLPVHIVQRLAQEAINAQRQDIDIHVSRN